MWEKSNSSFQFTYIDIKLESHRMSSSSQNVVFLTASSWSSSHQSINRSCELVTGLLASSFYGLDPGLDQVTGLTFY